MFAVPPTVVTAVCALAPTVNINIELIKQKIANRISGSPFTFSRVLKRSNVEPLLQGVVGPSLTAILLLVHRSMEGNGNSVDLQRNFEQLDMIAP